MIVKIKGSACCLWLMLVIISLSRSYAQYNEPREYAPSEARYISAGAIHIEFTPRSSNTQTDSLKIRFTGVMPMVSFRQGAAEAMFGYTRYTLAGISRSTIFFGARFGTEFPMVGPNSSSLLFPLVLAADFTKAESIGASRDDFNVASVGIGGGLKYRYVGSAVDFSVAVEELAQYSSEGIGVGSGFSASTLGDAIVLLRNVDLLDGVAIGYRFRLQTWSMNQNKLQYRNLWHGPYLGIMF